MICSERKLISLEASSGENKLISCYCISVDLLKCHVNIIFIEAFIYTLSLLILTEIDVINISNPVLQMRKLAHFIE